MTATEPDRLVACRHGAQQHGGRYRESAVLASREKVQSWIASGVSWSIATGVRARVNSRCAHFKVMSSRVWVEIRHAMSSPNGELETCLRQSKQG